jgi:hypothetical protein
MSDLRDARGCLTDAGWAALAGAVPGAAPPELAQHVASCARCQELWLKSTVPETRRPRPTPAETSRRRWGMLAIVLGVLLFALVALVVTLQYVAG